MLRRSATLTALALLCCLVVACGSTRSDSQTSAPSEASSGVRGGAVADASGESASDRAAAAPSATGTDSTGTDSSASSSSVPDPQTTDASDTDGSGIDGSDAEHTAQLAELGRAIEAGALDEARARLADLVDALLAEAPPVDGTDERLAELESLDALAAQLGALDDQRRVREAAVAILERAGDPDDLDLLAATGRLAVTLQQAGDPSAALVLETRVHDAFERLLPPTHPDLLSAKQNLAISRYRLGDLAGAHELFEYVHAMRGETLEAEDPDLLTAKQNLAVTRSDFGDMAGAHELESEVLEVRERLLDPDDPTLLAAKLNLASTRYALGDFAGARDLFEDVHAARERLLPPDHPSLLSAKMNLAGLRHGLGDLEGALRLFEQVHAARERLLPPGDPDLLSIKQNLAVTRRSLGDMEGARDMAEQVVRGLEGVYPPDHPDLLRARLNLASAKRGVGDVQGAHALYESVHSAQERLLPADHPSLLAVKLGLAWSRAALGDREGALELERTVHAAFSRTRPPDHPQLLIATLNLAGSLKALGEFEDALELERGVHEVWGQLLPPDHPDRITATTNLATSLELAEDFDGLEALVRELLGAQVAVAESLRTRASRMARSSAIGEIERLPTLLHWGKRLGESGRDPLDRELFEALESLRQVSTASIDVARAAAANGTLAGRLAHLAEVGGTLADRSQAGPGDGEPVEAWRTSLLALAEQRDSLQREVRLALSVDGVEADLPGADEVAGALASDAALVCYFRCWQLGDARIVDGVFERDGMEDRLLAFVVTADARVRRIELGASEPAVEALIAWRRALGTSPLARGMEDDEEERPATVEEAGVALRVQVLDPILELLPEVAALHVVADDVLHLVPLDALPLAGGVVGDRVAIRNVTSIGQLVWQRTRTDRTDDGVGTARLVALGGVEYGPAGATQAPFAELPGTLDEVRAIGALFGATHPSQALVLEGAGATKARLRELAPTATCLHVATHGWFAPESTIAASLEHAATTSATSGESARRATDAIVDFLPETLCGLALADANAGVGSDGRVPGVLTAEELSSLDLTRCELAVLSACETNVGLRRSGQGLLSLQAALHAAGARTAITSLWKVDDAATRRLFEHFYTALWEDGAGTADALWRAKTALRDEGLGVRDWAGWVLTGDPN